MSSNSEKRIFDEAIEIKDPTERSNFVASACGDDSQLLAKVAALLIAADDVDNFMQQNAADSFDLTTHRGDVSEQVGRTIGRYKLLEQIGEGGFGVVYMADQLEPVQRRVALKIIKAGMDTKQVIARFEAERQALALMDHPHIAKVLDAGETEQGRPYFVMELVHGVPVTEYCDDHRLSTEKRLRLFIEICAAVQHAHQKGIIHRDIKPGNVLVYSDGDRPVPKIIDFGIAKATQGRLIDKTLFTQFRQFVGTPSYMSPEQARMSGGDIDTRSDIYSLGVLLYELLTGKTPLDADSLVHSGYEEICRRIREEEALKPSKRLSSLQADELTTLAKQRRVAALHFPSSVKGDLDWIVMKAVEKEPGRRYESCGALAADVERYLKDEPIAACPPSVVYYARKLVRRHRKAAITAAAFAITVVLAAIVSSLGWRNSSISLRTAEAAKRQAVEERRRAIHVAYLADMHVAHQALDGNRLGLARRILELNRHFDPGDDPRHWEYRALWSRCQADAETSFGLEDGSIQSLSVHPSGNTIVTGGHRIRVWDVATEQILHEFPTDGVGQFAPNGDLIYATEPSGVVRAWRLPDFEDTDFRISHGSSFSYTREMQISPDGKLLATFGDDGDVVLWDVQTEQTLKRVRTEQRYCQLVFSHDSSLLAIGGNAGIRIVDLASLEVRDFLDDNGRPLGGLVSFSPDGTHIARYANQTLTIHRVTDASVVSTREVRDHAVLTMCCSPNGAIWATGSDDRTIVLHDVESGEFLARLREHDLAVSRLAFLPDGRLVSAGRDGRICVWNVEEAKKKTQWPISVPDAYKWNGFEYWPAMSFSPHGQQSRQQLCRCERAVRPERNGGRDSH